MPIRFDNLATSPYQKYTQYEVDMRRKAEILKYRASNKSSMQNNLTKAQTFSQIVNGTYQNITTDNNCPNTIINTPTYYSDVPGPTQNLFLDPSIPLYNLKDVRSYPGYYNSVDEKWEYVSYTDVACNSNSDNSIGSIFIRSGIDDANYTFSLTVPVNIYISGTNNTQTETQIDFIRQISTISIISATCYIYYNDISLNTPGIARRVSPVAIYDGLSDITLDTSQSGGNNFSATIYSGYITFNNINLYTANGYVYDLKVSINTDLNLNDLNYAQSDYYSPINYYAVINPTTANIVSNCFTTTSNLNATKIITFTGTNSQNISKSSSVVLHATVNNGEPSPNTNTGTNTNTTVIPYSVSNSGSGAYLINNVSNATIYLTRGSTYKFTIAAINHPFWIQTTSPYNSGNVYSNGITNNGTQSGDLIFTVPATSPATLYYVCQNHSSMGGTIVITG